MTRALVTQHQGTSTPRLSCAADAAPHFFAHATRAAPPQLARKPAVDAESVLDALGIAETFELPRLEERCYQVLARELDQVVHSQQFLDMVRASAMSIRDRQATDTIPLIDGLRAAVQAIYGRAYVEDEEAEREQVAEDQVPEDSEFQRRRRLIDATLAKLGLATAIRQPSPR